MMAPQHAIFPRSMPSPLVSIIIPAFNASVFIEGTIRSALAQTYAPTELIVVDDGSTDDTAARVAALAARHPTIRLIRQSNAGVAAARNTAVAHARGSYIALLDADDLWHPEKLARQVAHARRAGSHVGMVYCWFRRIDETGRQFGHRSQGEAEGDVACALTLRNLVGNGSVPLYSAHALRTVGPFLTREDQRGAQGADEWEMQVRVAERFETVLVRECLVFYRQCRSSVTADTRSMRRSVSDVLRRIRTRNPHMPASVFRWSRAQVYRYLGRRAREGGRRGQALVCSGLAALLDPLILLDVATTHRVARALLSPGFTSTAQRAVRRIEERRWTSALAVRSPRYPAVRRLQTNANEVSGRPISSTKPPVQRSDLGRPTTAVPQ